MRRLEEGIRFPSVDGRTGGIRRGNTRCQLSWTLGREGCARRALGPLELASRGRGGEGVSDGGGAGFRGDWRNSARFGVDLRAVVGGGGTDWAETGTDWAASSSATSWERFKQLQWHIEWSYLLARTVVSVVWMAMEAWMFRQRARPEDEAHERIQTGAVADAVRLLHGFVDTCTPSAL